eukprot:c27138_g1_i1.p1 GENE.c27138_g1_i1~~c27138_g1_i1.p1  ORF type:complete len:312 (+),score=84.55 c27138_g1_i1:134-937(+)
MEVPKSIHKHNSTNSANSDHSGFSRATTAMSSDDDDDVDVKRKKRDSTATTTNNTHLTKGVSRADSLRKRTLRDRMSSMSLSRNRASSTSPPSPRMLPSPRLMPKQLVAAASEAAETTFQIVTAGSSDNVNNILFMKALKAKLTSKKIKKALKNSNMYSMSSFPDTAVEAILHEPKEYIKFNTRAMSRIYPDPKSPKSWLSANYFPLNSWILGAQAVALNYQRFDKPMHINDAFFQLNGGCGYVLKPDYMRDPANRLITPSPKQTLE